MFPHNDSLFHAMSFVLYLSGMAMCLNFLSEELIAVAYEDGSIAVWDIQKQKITSEWKFFNEPGM